MKTLLVLFTLCGQPTFVVGDGAQGALVGSVPATSEKAIDLMISIYDTPGAIVLVQPLEDLTGLVCV